MSQDAADKRADEALDAIHDAEEVGVAALVQAIDNAITLAKTAPLSKGKRAELLHQIGLAKAVLG